MLEVLSQYARLDPLTMGLLLAPLGLAVGSFCSVIRHRVARGESVVAPRSYCPSCRHTLGAVDLVPVLSYLWLRGKCRHCRAPIPARYLALECLCGLAAFSAGMLGGWSAGLSVLLVLPVSTSLLAMRNRPRSRQTQEGFSLIEVLVSVLILSLSLAPALDTIQVTRKAGLVAQQRSLMVGLARGRLAQLAGIASTSGLTGLDGQPMAVDGSDVIPGLDSGRYQVTFAVLPKGHPDLRLVKVTVTCTQCVGESGPTVKPVTLSTIVQGW